MSEMPLPRELFAHVQDAEEMGRVMAACRDKPFWVWAATSYTKIFRDLEYLRRWDMVCECPAHREERKRIGCKKFIRCPRTHQYSTFDQKDSLPPIFINALHSINEISQSSDKGCRRLVALFIINLSEEWPPSEACMAASGARDKLRGI